MVKILNFLCVFFVSLLTLLPSSLFADVTKTINKSDIYPYVKADRPFVSPLTGKPLSNEGWTLTNEFGHFCHTFSEDIKELGHTGEDWIKYEDNWRNISGDKPIYSINNGVVLWSGLHTAGNGHAILIKHESHEKNGFIIPSTNHADDNKDSTCDPKGDGSATYSYSSSERRSSEVYSFYLHLGESLVKAGDSVYAGQRIGDLYTTQERIDNGYAYVPHLHFELWSSLEETSDNDLTVSFIDSQGYDTLRQFRNRLVSRLTNPSSFILTNNILPLVTGIERTDDKKIVISGKGFGISPGKVKVESSMFKDTISHISWKDDQVVTSDLAPFLASKNVKHPSTLRFTLETDAIRDSNTRSWPFDDVLPSDWFSEYAFYFYSHGIVKGFGQKRELSPAPLGPGNNVNFAEFLKITLKAYYHVVGNASYSQCSEAPAPYPVFPLSSSEAGNWYCEYYNNELVQSALLKLNELTASVSRGSAGQYVKRKEAALLIQKIFDLPLLTSELSFSDISSEHSFYDWISSSRKYGIFNGYSDNSFGGEKEIMRSEMLKIIRFALSIKSKLEEE